MKKIGFIGTGNMGSALARAVSKKAGGERLLLANRTPQKSKALAIELGALPADNRQVALEADFIFLGVKPQGLPPLLSELSPLLRSRKEPALLISMAAGTSIFRIKELLSFSCPIIQIMPNTPAAVGEGMLLYSAGEGVSEQDLEEFRSLLSDAGRLLALPEEQLDAGSALSGCGPAFVCLFAEALADGGVLSGLKRQDALLLAAQTLLGTAKLLLVSGKHPGELKDQVCSPGGTTIEGVRQLEEAGFRGSVTNAVFASFEKNKRLG